jgi:hypothetical protein
VSTGFTNDELDVLAVVLKEYLTDLRSEILDTDDHDYRQALKDKEEALKEVLSKLERARVTVTN